MINREELLSSEEYWMGHIQAALFNRVREHLLATGKTQTELAEQMGVTKSYISQVLNGDFDHKLSKLVQLSLAVGLVPVVQFTPLEQVLQEGGAAGYYADSVMPVESTSKPAKRPYVQKEFEPLMAAEPKARKIGKGRKKS